MRHILASAILMALTVAGRAQQSEPAVGVTFYSPSIVRVQKTWNDTIPAKQSFSVTMEPGDVKDTTWTDGNATFTASSLLMVRVEGSNVEFLDGNGNLLLREGECSTLPCPDISDAPANQTFMLQGNEPIYGLGILQEGRMDLRGTDRRMIQGNTDDYCNIIQSIKGYGLFWDNCSPTTFTSDDASFTFRSEHGGMVDYYFIYGKTGLRADANADGVIAGIRRLTGTVPMQPLWSYGFMQSRERYKSSSELLDVLRKYRETGVPVDCIIQDWQYWGNNYLWNAMEFNDEGFRNPERWISQIHGMNAKLMISIWSSFGPQTKQYAELKPKGLLLDFQTWPQSGLNDWPPRMDYPSGVRPYDPFSKEARDIYWNHLTRLFNLDIDGWWMDSTEPDHHDFKESDLDLPTGMGPLRQVRNAYPLLAVGGVYDNQRAAGSDKRVLILTRSAFAGQQRYGSNTWSGDVQSNWESLRAQIPAGLNFALTGNPNFNSDLGGFFASAYNENYGDESATRNPLYQELYARWMQYGIFCPMMRSHGTEVPRELYHYGQAGEPVYDALLGAVKMRYALLPYIYALAHEVSASNGTFQRALMMDFKADENVWDINDEFMFGRSLLVAPVVNAQYTPERAVPFSRSGLDGAVDFTAEKDFSLYLPAGTRWYDWNTGTRYEGGSEVTVSTTLATVPLFVRAGSIIPIGPDVQYSTEKPWDDLEIRIYAGANATFTLYEDGGDGYDYEKGAFSTIDFNWDDHSRTLRIAARKGSFPGMLKSRQFRVTVISGPSASSRSVKTAQDDSDQPQDGKAQLQDGNTSSQRTVEYDGRSIFVKL